MKNIPLRKGHKESAFVAIVDDENFELLSKHRWSVIKSHNTHYARRFEGPAGNQKLILMHRVVMNAEPGVEIDHKSGNGLDNRRENLRPATRSQQLWNSCLHKRNKSGVRGVCWYPQKSRWQTWIMVRGKRKSLGNYVNFDDAVAARKSAEKEHYGEYARTL